MNYITRLIPLIERLRFLLLGTILFLIPFVIDSHIKGGTGPDTKFRFFEYLIILALLFTIPLLFQRRVLGYFNPLRLSVLLFSVYLIFRAVIDANFEFALDNAGQSVCWLVFALLLADACKDIEDFKELLFVGVIAQIPVVIYAFGEIFKVDIYLDYILRRPDWVWSNELMNAERSLIYALGNPNYYASYSSMLLIWTGVLFYLSEKRWSKIAWGFYIFVITFTLIYTFARGIWISLFAAVFCVSAPLLTPRITFRKIQIPWSVFSNKWVLVLLFLMISGGVATQLHSIQGKNPLQIMAKRFQTGFKLRDSSLRTRPLLWYAALHLWKSNPAFGAGHGQYGVQFIETIYDLTKKSDAEQIQEITRNMNTLAVQEAHNDYLQYLAETGAVGYGLFLLLFVTAWWAGASRLSKLPKSDEFALLFGCLLVVVFIIFQSMHDFPLRLPASSIWFSMALGGILLIDNQPERFSRFTWPCIAGRVLASVLLLACLLFSGWMVTRHLTASHLYHKAEQLKDPANTNTVTDSLQRKSQLNMAKESFRKADELFPGDGMTLLGLGQTYYLLSNYVESSMTDNRNRAIRSLEDARKTFTNPQFYHLLGFVYLETNRIAKAQWASEILRMIDPVSKDAQLLAGKVALALGRVSEAVAFFQEEIANHPDNIEACGYLGEIYEKNLKDYSKSVQMYLHILQIDPRVLDCYERLANLYDVQLNQPEQALEYYQKTVEFLKGQMNSVNKVKNLEKRIKELQEIMNGKNPGK